MPVPLEYLGLYIEELPSGSRTITGVATSITAFLGRAPRGPVDDPVVVNSFADFERQFGGLWVDSPMSYAVRDFYRNGGTQAVVARVYNGGGAASTTASCNLASAAAAFTLQASSPGTWGDRLRARVDDDVADMAAGTLFNLTIRDDATGQIEVFRNVSIVADHPRRADLVVNNESSLADAPNPPDPGNLPTPHAAQTAAAPLWGDNATNTKFDATAGDDGIELAANDYTLNTEATKSGLFALDKVDLFNLLCIPPHGANDVEPVLVGDAAAYCERRRAILIVDPPRAWTDKADAVAGVGAVGTSSNHAALYFPRLLAPNPLRENQIEPFAPCGAIAGVIARTDAQRGVWKAPAGLDATIAGALALSVPLTDAENGELNPLGVNCLRAFPAAGRVVWGARTLQGADRLASEWKYLPVRRTALFIEESLFRGTQWVVFEPNAEPLWAQIRLNVGAFMNRLFRQGAFAGTTARDAYFVKCDRETTTQTDVNLGVVNIVVGFAPLQPAEFVVIQLQQMAGQVNT